MYRLFIKRNAEKLIFVFAVAAASLAAGVVFCHMRVDEQLRLQRHLADEVLRFHVIANSDSDRDQELKLKVRDAVLDYFAEEMPESADASQAASWAREHTDEIETVSRDVLASSGSDDVVNAAVTTCFSRTGHTGILHFRRETMRLCVSRSAKRKDTTGGACSIRTCVFWILQTQLYQMREKRN